MKDKIFVELNRQFEAMAKRHEYRDEDGFYVGGKYEEGWQDALNLAQQTVENVFNTPSACVSLKSEKQEAPMKIYISQSLTSKTSEEYLAERKEITRQIRAEYGDDVEIIGDYVKDKWTGTDKAFFAPGWQDDNDCVKEHEECVQRGIDIIYDGLSEVTNREKLLDEAKRIVCGDRDRQYGHPEDAFRVIAEMWTSYLGTEITAADVCDMMILLKVARNSFHQKHDNLVDIAGYAACAAECN
jgi:hypothetical protein